MGFDELPTPLEAFNTTERERITYDAHIRLLRQHKYPMLGGITYLNRGRTTLASKTLLKAFCEEIITILLANPHFNASEPSPSSSIFFDADPDHFDVVFTANATPAIKLVIECFSNLSSRFNHVYHRNCHTSLIVSAHHPKIFTLLDVAAFASTTPLDLSNYALAPDFAVLSFYKIFSFSNLRALIVRRSASPILEHQKYFRGGTTEMTTKDTSIHARLEDSTLAIRSILALPLTSVYGDPKTQRATFIIPYAISSILRSNNIYVRTGSLCNPAGIAPALGLSSAGMRAAFDKGFRCNQRSDLYENSKPISIVRVTIGAISTLGDIKRLVECIKQQLIEPGHGTRNTPKVDMKPRADVLGRRRKSRLGCQVPFICLRYCTSNYQRQYSARD
ncbi:hypothetical protein HBH53_260410 [Parastagonospora nodorum]|nr:hypothetical protein HBH53_260410 [Parastagonospora nodorum]